MRLSVLSILAACAWPSAAKWTNNDTEPIELSPAPWTLRGDVYGATFIPLQDLPVKAFSPLERGTAVQTEGTFVGGIGMIQVIRYKESPVGPYDELLIVPGFYKYDHPDGPRKNVRISRIYVSQKYTCWNGRTNWNIPKHLARFDWTDGPGGSKTVKVYPFDTTGDANESTAADKPWFKATFSPDILSGLPFSTDLYTILGVNATLAQPPLPGKDSFYDELPSTDRWAAVVPGQASKKTSLQVFNFYQGEGDREEGSNTNSVGDEYYSNFWPGLLPLHPGMKLEDAEITFSEPEIWEAEN